MSFASLALPFIAARCTWFAVRAAREMSVASDDEADNRQRATQMEGCVLIGVGTLSVVCCVKIVETVVVVR